MGHRERLHPERGRADGFCEKRPRHIHPDAILEEYSYAQGENCREATSMQARRVLVLLSFILLIFAVWAKVDYAIHGYMGYFPPEAVVSYHWFWQWTAGVPLTAGALAAAFWAGAPKSKLNRNVAVGIFLTVILLSVGQLEDFFYFTLNSVPFPTDEWAWFRGMWFYRIFGTWTTEIHFTWLALWTTLTVAMWLLILKRR